MSNSVFGWSETYAPSENRICARPSTLLTILSPLLTSAPLVSGGPRPSEPVTVTLPMVKSTLPVLANAGFENAADTTATIMPRGLSLKRFGVLFTIFSLVQTTGSVDCSMPPSARKYFISERLAQRKRNHGSAVLVQIDIGLIVRVGDLRHQQPARPQRVVHSQANIGLSVAAGHEEDRVVPAVHAPLVAHQAEQHRFGAHGYLTAESGSDGPVSELRLILLFLLFPAAVKAAENDRLARAVPAVAEGDAGYRAPRIPDRLCRVCESGFLDEERHLAVLAVAVLPLRHDSVASPEIVVVDSEILALISRRDRFLAARPAQPEVAVHGSRVEIALVRVEFSIDRGAGYDRPFPREPVHHAHAAACRREGVVDLHSAWSDGGDDAAERRDRDLVGGRSAVGVAVPAEADLEKPAELCGTHPQGRQVSVDGLLDGFGRIGRADVLEFTQRVFFLAQQEIGAGDLGARLSVVGIHGKYPFQREHRPFAFPRVEGCDSEEIVVFGVAGALGFQRLEQPVSRLRILLLEQESGAIGDLVCEGE